MSYFAVKVEAVLLLRADGPTNAAATSGDFLADIAGRMMAGEKILFPRSYVMLQRPTSRELEDLVRASLERAADEPPETDA